MKKNKRRNPVMTDLAKELKAITKELQNLSKTTDALVKAVGKAAPAEAPKKTQKNMNPICQYAFLLKLKYVLFNIFKIILIF